MMSSVSSVEAGLPAGFRFHPKDEELVTDYLMRWVRGCPHPYPSFLCIHLNSTEPWDLPESACVGSKEWYFYSQRDRKYATGLRTNRATSSGYWKATGKDRPVFENETLVGMRKTLVFYKGRAPKGRKTEWVMHEFRLDRPDPKTTAAGASSSPPPEDWVLCRVFSKKRGDQSPEYEVQTQPSFPGVPGLAGQPHLGGDHPRYGQVPCFSTLNIGSQTSPNFSDAMALGPHRPQIPPQPSDVHLHLPAPDRLRIIPDNKNYDGYYCRYDSSTSLEMTTMKAYYGDVRPTAGGGGMVEAGGSSLPISFVEAGGNSDGTLNYLSSEVGVGLLSSLWNPLL